MSEKRNAKEIYNENDLREILKNETTADMSLFYRKPYVYNTEIVNGTNKRCDEFVAEYLIEQLSQTDLLKEKIPKISRDRNYNVQHKYNPVSEERFAKTLHYTKIGDIGEIIDYQTPINKTRRSGAGDVDLLAYNEKTNILSLVELKLLKNPDTMLHTILQIDTYFRQIDKDKLRKEFGHPDAKIQKVVLIFRGSKQDQEFASESIQNLANKLDVQLYLFDCTKLPTP
jgi:hypothetical protein